MSQKQPAIVCSCELDNGYIFKNYFGFTSFRGRPVITFLADKVVAPNRTADNQIFGNSTLHGDEINLTWDESIPLENRNLSLTFDVARIQPNFGRIKKKDQAKIYIAQAREVTDPYNFSGPKSSNEFIIYVSCGTGGDGREGLRSIAATRTDPDNTRIKYPQHYQSSMLVVPVRAFRQMIDSFAKCKKESIKVRFYQNQETNGRPGILLTTDVMGHSGGIIEKYGDVPDEGARGPGQQPYAALTDIRIDESAVVRPASSSKLVIEVEKPPVPNEFTFSADKIPIFAKLASMHNEGNVRIWYQPGCHLRVAHRYGAFGSTELCLHNQYVSFD